MDKKDFSGIIIVLVVLYLIMIIPIIFGSMVATAQDKACQELGYKEFVYYRIGPDFCKDYEGNLHYVEWGYNKFPKEIWLKEFSVGDVRDINKVVTEIVTETVQ